MSLGNISHVTERSNHAMQVSNLWPLAPKPNHLTTWIMVLVIYSIYNTCKNRLVKFKERRYHLKHRPIQKIT